MEDSSSIQDPIDLEEEKILILRKPLVVADVTYDHLDLREPTAKELADASKAGNDVEVAIALISMIAKVPKSAVNQLRQRDLKDASDFFARFNGDYQETGKTLLRN